MARFKCESHPNLLVIGAGKFSDGVLEVEGAKAEKVRAVANSGIFTITEDKPTPKRGRPAKTESDK